MKIPSPARFVALVGLLVTPACKASASGSDAGLAPLEPNPAPALVAKADCERWADHGVDTLLADWAAAVATCPEPQRAALADKLESQRVTLHAAALALCTTHLGAAYSPRDARCYLEARSAKALADCQLAPMTNPGDTDMGAQIARIRASCAAPQPGGTNL